MSFFFQDAAMRLQRELHRFYSATHELSLAHRSLFDTLVALGDMSWPLDELHRAAQVCSGKCYRIIF